MPALSDTPPAVGDDAVRRVGLPGRLAFAVWAVTLVVGLALLVIATGDLGEAEWLSRAGAALVGGGYAVALLRRVGGRPWLALFGSAAVTVALAVWWSEVWLRNGTALLLAVVSSLLAVLATKAAPTLLTTVRELLVAVIVAAGGALAVVGLEPEVSLLRFEYAALIVALVAAVWSVHRLGAGLHGLGRRGAAVFGVLAVVMCLGLLYGEAVRAYGSPSIEGGLAGAATWSRDHLGAFPRPLLALIGVPALVWGVHMRSRRPQGWWVTAFGVLATGTVTLTLMRPRLPWGEAALTVLYGAVIGLVLGWVLIRLDVALTGSHGRRARRRARTLDLEPVEPRRTAPLK